MVKDQRGNELQSLEILPQIRAVLKVDFNDIDIKSTVFSQ